MAMTEYVAPVWLCDLGRVPPSLSPEPLLLHEGDGWGRLQAPPWPQHLGPIFLDDSNALYHG